MVYVEVKHYVYQRASARKATDLLRSLQSRYHVTFLSCLTVRRFPKQKILALNRQRKKLNANACGNKKEKRKKEEKK